jgi:hypothetical protein
MATRMCVHIFSRDSREQINLSLVRQNYRAAQVRRIDPEIETLAYVKHILCLL